MPAIALPPLQRLPRPAMLGFISPTAEAWGRCYMRCLEQELAHSAHSPGQRMAAVAQQAQDLFDEETRWPLAADACVALGAFALLIATCRTAVAALQAEQLACRCFNRTYQSFIRHVCQPLNQGNGACAKRLQQLNFEDFSADLPGAAVGHHSHSYARLFERHDSAGLIAIVAQADRAWRLTQMSPASRSGVANKGSSGISDPDAAFEPFWFAPGKAAPPRPPTEWRLQLTSNTGRPGRHC